MITDRDKQLWKQDQEFKELCRNYAFLAEMLIYNHQYKTVRERDDLQQIIRVCGVIESTPYWDRFRGQPPDIAHQRLNAWWQQRRIGVDAIALLDAAYQDFLQGVREDERNRLAGAKRPSLRDIVRGITLNRKGTDNLAKRTTESPTDSFLQKTPGGQETHGLQPPGDTEENETNGGEYA